jgi:glutamine amidotransferase
MKVAVIDYGMGNLHSVSKALEFVGADVMITQKSSDLKEADRVVLPGVGSFAEGMRQLEERGLVNVLNDEVIARGKPFLGICLGMQLAAESGEEHGKTRGLGWIKGSVIRLDTNDPHVKVPHMGWNDIEVTQPSPLFKNIRGPLTFYFVHSYHLMTAMKDAVTAVCEHGLRFAAAVERENIHLVQFHPEKSQTAGLKVLENFLAIEHVKKQNHSHIAA